MNWINLGVALALFFAAFTQAVTGFGSALLAMPLLAQIVGVHTGANLLALVSLPMNVTLLLVQRASFRLRAVWGMALAAVVGIPLGVLALHWVEERIVLVGLGVILSAYALYALITPRLPDLRHAGWDYLFGFLSGVLAGAYNVGGPPAVVYATGRGWEPGEFRSNLQALFMIENIFVLVTRAGSGEFTADLWNLVGIALAALVLGIAAGLLLDRFLPAALFRKLALVLLLALGLRLLIPV